MYPRMVTCSTRTRRVPSIHSVYATAVQMTPMTPAEIHVRPSSWNPVLWNCQRASGSTNSVSPAASAIEIVADETILVRPLTDTV